MGTDCQDDLHSIFSDDRGIPGVQYEVFDLLVLSLFQPLADAQFKI